MAFPALVRSLDKFLIPFVFKLQLLSTLIFFLEHSPPLGVVGKVGAEARSSVAWLELMVALIVFSDSDCSDSSSDSSLSLFCRREYYRRPGREIGIDAIHFRPLIDVRNKYLDTIQPSF